jgi:hypothetical protein
MKVWLTILLAGATAGLNAQDFGPIATRNHRSLSLPFLRIAPRSGVLNLGESRLGFGWTVANEFRGLPEKGPYAVFEDQETSRFDLSFRRGLAGGREWSVEVPVIVRGGGFLDPVISWWHKNVLGWSDPGRAATPDGRCEVTVPGAHFGSAWGLGDVSAAFSQRLSGNLVGTASLKLPTGNARQLLGSGAVDAGVALDWNTPLGSRWTLFAQGGLIVQGKATELPNSRDLVHQELVGFMYKPNSRDAWIAQWQGEASSTETGVPGSDATHRLLTFGYQRRLSSTHFLEMFFSEDRDVFNGRFPEGANLGPDFTAGLRLTVKL